MKKLLNILFCLPLFAGAQTQVSINFPDSIIQLPASAINIQACVSLCGTTPSSMSWKQVSGPTVSLSSSSGTSTTIVSNFQPGVARIAFVVVDNTGAIKSDTLNITFLAPPNKPPVANAGKDTTFNLPQNAVILDGINSFDPDGSIASYAWSGVNIVMRSGTQALVYGLPPGTYSYVLTVTDNQGASASDTVQVTVNSAIVCPVCPVCPPPVVCPPLRTISNIQLINGQLIFTFSDGGTQTL